VRTIVIGLMAAIPLIGTACGDDDDGSVFAQLEEDVNAGEDIAQEDSSEASNPGGDYPEEVQQEFMRACTSQPGAGPGACECALDHLMANLSYPDFAAMEQELEQNPLATPQPIQDAIAACT
jgi:hypothetical protein